MESRNYGNSETEVNLWMELTLVYSWVTSWSAGESGRMNISSATYVTLPPKVSAEELATLRRPYAFKLYGMSPLTCIIVSRADVNTKKANLTIDMKLLARPCYAIKSYHTKASTKKECVCFVCLMVCFAHTIFCKCIRCWFRCCNFSVCKLNRWGLDCCFDTSAAANWSLHI